MGLERLRITMRSLSDLLIEKSVKKVRSAVYHIISKHFK